MTRTRALLVVSLCALAAGPALAQPKAEGRAALVQRLSDCRKLGEDPARLACYDQATAALEQAEAKGDIVVVDREQARTVQRQAFGFSLPSLSVFDRGEEKEAVDNVTGKITSARMDGAGKWVLKLEDGAVWQQIDVQELSLYPKAGQSVTIRKATLGSFLASVEGRRAFRVRRVE
ncbi:hypothetical protein LRS10_01525 [Phenylobacterium sp. J426]|uniref:hypothetical protein n=1 Tax=Phenylobacterium sp. J426 TaxID=2898439 RepID=UPI0021519D53|nr:hypothetical protein [Phenylobacterium sp. J426]MCR5872989.1 hypothetical protein [Phenylobacterium sp. J426]